MDIVSDDNGYDDGHYCEDNQGENEADPSLFACGTSWYDGFLGVSEAETYCWLIWKEYPSWKDHIPDFCVFFDIASSWLDNVNCLVLLLNKNAHLQSQTLEDGSSEI